MRHSAQGRGPGIARRGGGGAARDGARRDGVAQRGMRGLPRGGFGRTDGTVNRGKRNEELGIFVDCHSIDGVDRGESVDASIGLVDVLTREQD